MSSALFKKSWGDMKRRKSRTVFTILTIALAVGALGMFGVMPIMDRAMFNEVEESNLYDVEMRLPTLELDNGQIEDLEGICNVKGVEGKQIFRTRIYIGERRGEAIVIGIDPSDQKVDIVNKESGHDPGFMELWTDPGNSRNDVYNGEFGDRVVIFDHAGNEVELEIVGEGRSLRFDHYNRGTTVFFTNMETISYLSNESGYNLLSIDLERSTQEEAGLVIDSFRTYLQNNTEFLAFMEVPEVREDGNWPGKEGFADMSTFFYVLTFMTLGCSIFLIYNTMHTMITEQRKEIAQMKAIGATKLQVVRSYMTTALMMGAIGSAIGSVIGIFIAYGMVNFIASSFYGVVPSFGIYIRAVLISALVGMGIAVFATLPALLGALRVSVREGMESAGITANYGNSVMDKALMRMRWVPRPVQMGLRNVARKKKRSISTILQVALAVGMFLAVVSIGYSLTESFSEMYDNYPSDILVTGQVEGGKPLTEDVQYILEDIDGVEKAEPMIYTYMNLGEDELGVFGYSHDTIAYDVEKTTYKGRWFTQEEAETRADVVVITKTLGRLELISVGDTITVETASGPHDLEVIGLNSGQMEGMDMMMPRTTLQKILMWNDTVTGFAVKTESGDHSQIDSVSTQIEDTMLSKGYVTNNMIWYVLEEESLRSNQKIINLMIIVGSLVVFITMIGLMSTLTMNIIERTKEIGIMRCIGARSSDVRHVFATEGLMLALIGGVVGIPTGYAVGSYLNWVFYDVLHLEMDFLYPMKFVVIALIVTLVTTIVVIQLPLRRATGFKPGDALRYA